MSEDGGQGAGSKGQRDMKSEVGMRKSEVGMRESENGEWRDMKSEVGMIRLRIADFGFRNPVSGVSVSAKANSEC